MYYWSVGKPCFQSMKYIFGSQVDLLLIYGCQVWLLTWNQSPLHVHTEVHEETAQHAHSPFLSHLGKPLFILQLPRANCLKDPNILVRLATDLALPHVTPTCFPDELLKRNGSFCNNIPLGHPSVPWTATTPYTHLGELDAYEQSNVTCFQWAHLNENEPN